MLWATLMARKLIWQWNWMKCLRTGIGTWVSGAVYAKKLLLYKGQLQMHFISSHIQPGLYKWSLPPRVPAFQAALGCFSIRDSLGINHFILPEGSELHHHLSSYICNRTFWIQPVFPPVWSPVDTLAFDSCNWATQIDLWKTSPESGEGFSPRSHQLLIS